MAIWLGNALSLSMLPSGGAQLVCLPLDLAEAQILSQQAESVVGHADTAALFASLLGRDVAVQRRSLALEAGDVLLVGQYSGPRLPEGAVALPTGAELRWWRVEVLAPTP
jgi:hypothetical protein